MTAVDPTLWWHCFVFLFWNCPLGSHSLHGDLQHLGAGDGARFLWELEGSRLLDRLKRFRWWPFEVATASHSVFGLWGGSSPLFYWFLKGFSFPALLAPCSCPHEPVWMKGFSLAAGLVLVKIGRSQVYEYDCCLCPSKRFWERREDFPVDAIYFWKGFKPPTVESFRGRRSSRLSWEDVPGGLSLQVVGCFWKSRSSCMFRKRTRIYVETALGNVANTTLKRLNMVSFVEQETLQA